jgi:hypothetical protein
MTARYFMATCVSAIIALVLVVIGFIVIFGASARPSNGSANNLSRPNEVFARAMAFANLAVSLTNIRNGRIAYNFSGLLENYEGSFDASPTDVDKWVRLSPSIRGAPTTTLPDGSTKYQLVCPSFIEGTVTVSADHGHVSFRVNSYT